MGSPGNEQVFPCPRGPSPRCRESGREMSKLQRVKTAHWAPCERFCLASGLIAGRAPQADGRYRNCILDDPDFIDLRSSLNQ